MYIYTPLCRYWIALYRYVLVFIVSHVDIELEDNKQFISNIPRIYKKKKMCRLFRKNDHKWCPSYMFVPNAEYTFFLFWESPNCMKTKQPEAIKINNFLNLF